MTLYSMLQRKLDNECDGYMFYWTMIIYIEIWLLEPHQSREFQNMTVEASHWCIYWRGNWSNHADLCIDVKKKKCILLLGRWRELAFSSYSGCEPWNLYIASCVYWLMIILLYTAKSMKQSRFDNLSLGCLLLQSALTK